MKTKLKFEDLKVGDKLVNEIGDVFKVIFKGQTCLVAKRREEEFVFNAPNLRPREMKYYLIDYYKPTPNKNDIFEELYSRRIIPPVHLDLAINIIAQLAPEKIKTLFNIKD